PLACERAEPLHHPQQHVLDQIGSAVRREQSSRPELQQGAVEANESFPVLPGPVTAESVEQAVGWLVHVMKLLTGHDISCRKTTWTEWPAGDGATDPARRPSAGAMPGR